MLAGPMVAVGVSRQALAVAVRKLSESAASWAALSPGRVGRSEGADQLETFIASSYSCWMSPRRQSVMRWRMSLLIDKSSRCSWGVGARMSISRWQRSHQNGAGSAVHSKLGREGLYLYDAASMARMMSPFSSRKSRLLLFLRKCRHVERKSGGSWE